MTAAELFTDELLARAGAVRETGNRDAAVAALEYDSRKALPGALYFALTGLHADGHDFITSAIENGARVIVHQNDIAEYNEDVFYLRVKDSRFAMSAISDAFYASPSKRLTVAGVTGTEGKSSTVYFIFQLLRLAGKKAGFISTVQYSVDGTERWNTEHQTTPEAVLVHKRLAEMLENGCEYAVLEASSHGLSPRTNRMGNIAFDAGVMTNVTHEHLEFHGTWEQYRDDKANLFRALDRSVNLGASAFGVVNADDPSAAYFAACSKRKTYTHSVKGGGADLLISGLSSYSRGSIYDVKVRSSGKTIHIEDRLPGAFNAGNVLASLLCVSNLLQIPVEELCCFVPKLKPVRGRMTAVDKGQSFEALVDYAHTPSSFETVLPPIRERAGKRGGRVISLFGSAGERDTQKRALQGRIAARYSDIIFLCDEDPRGEEPSAILEEIAEGVFSAPFGECFPPDGFKRGVNLFLIAERPAAIRAAFSAAKPGDIVLLLGKGHENSIIYSNYTMKYDEISEAENALLELLGGRVV
ncbi:MAG: UDP-N-acetylmuramoyl-L-alanyl-D-glutamate--2,6-diaminopimelate ligase [Spirochaetaceae bacterium]|jgi:UDP-N-acetylmuramoyl-L-alanyl-D-glutamate--2,6-diaminopimelate ligase|nr:UDP-N-acetylmuramoyl-L-alanyl-D-glutamate--2,6-diaminopimelate ligase [Spirochaetaceae bacterium]